MDSVRNSGVNNKTKAMMQYQTRLANKLERELNRLRSRRDDLRADLRSLRDAINTLRRDNVALNSDFENKSAELQALKHKLALMLERANQILEEQEMLIERRDEMNAVAKLEATRFEDQRSALLDEIDTIYHSLQSVTMKPSEQKAQEVCALLCSSAAACFDCIGFQLVPLLCSFLPYKSWLDHWTCNRRRPFGSKCRSYH